MPFDPRLAMLWLGIVQERDDPEKIGRVRVKIPGFIGKTAWAIPVGQAFGGAPGLGNIAPPPLSASVLVGFEAGEIEQPFYFPGPWPIGGAPPGHDVTATGDNLVFADAKLVIERDTRAGSSGYRITDRATGGSNVTLELDLESGQIQLTSKVGLLLKSTGAVRIEGATVMINNRPVMPTGKEI